MGIRSPTALGTYSSNNVIGIYLLSKMLWKRKLKPHIQIAPNNLKMSSKGNRV
jgi:hypothetical protein